MNSFSEKLIGNVSKVIVGKDKQIELLLVSLLVGGHVLLEDVPGTGKTKTAPSPVTYGVTVIFEFASIFSNRCVVLEVTASPWL